MRLVSLFGNGKLQSFYKATCSFCKLMQWIGCLLVSKGPNTPKKRGASTTCLDEIQAKLWHSIHKTISGPTYFLCLQLHLHSNSWLPNGIVQVCLQLPKQLERWRIFKQNDKTGNADWSALSLGSIQQLLIFCVDHGKPRFFLISTCRREAFGIAVLHRIHRSEKSCIVALNQAIESFQARLWRNLAGTTPDQR